MILPSATPQFRMSQGIVCSSPSLTITPYLTDAWSFNRPIETVTRQAIYDENTGEIKYYQETPRFEKDNYNLNYGISMQINIPLGKAPALCHEATQVNIADQKLLIAKTKIEIPVGLSPPQPPIIEPQESRLFLLKNHSAARIPILVAR